MRAPGRWALSPAYDLNPVPEIDRQHTPKTAITETGEEPTIEIALRTAPRFGLNPIQGRATVSEVLAVVKRWRAMGRKLKIKASTLDAYGTAFENPLTAEAEELV